MRSERRLAQVAFPLGMLLGQDVALVGVPAADFSRAGELHALAERTLRFFLWHLSVIRRSLRCDYHEHVAAFGPRFPFVLPPVLQRFGPPIQPPPPPPPPPPLPRTS